MDGLRRRWSDQRSALCHRAEHRVSTSTHRQAMNRAIPSVEPARATEPTAAVVVTGLGDELLTVNDAARFLHVTVSWVYEHTRDDADDRLPFVKLGKYVRFDRTDLREYVDAKRHAARTGARRR